MKTDLKEFVDQMKICDTHEHLGKQEDWEKDKPDILLELFDNYIGDDFITAGITEKDWEQLFDLSLDIEKRFNLVQESWNHIQFTGYGEASRYIAKEFFNIEEINAKTLAQAQATLPAQWNPNDRLRILKEDGGLHHTQTDDFTWICKRDVGGPDFFLYDLSWRSFCSGTVDLEDLYAEVQIEVKNLESLREAMEALFEKYAAVAIAVKAQHAYDRTLLWKDRSEGEVSKILDRVIQGKDLKVEEKNCLGDWCWARGVELSIEHHLPFKIHTGYYAGNDRMSVEFIKPGHLCSLLKRYPKARFVLMHVGYPYQEEMMAIAKHYRNVWVDMCWVWSSNPYVSKDFLRGFLHTAPINKLFGFGGDTVRPRASVAYALQARNWIAQALQEEVNRGEISEKQAIDVAERILQRNQLDCFDYEGTVKNIQKEG